MPSMDITAENWRILSGLLDDALDLPPDARESWLGSLRGPQLELRDELRRLLERYAAIETSDFLQTMPKVAAEPGIAAKLLGPGSRIGPYLIEGELGRGGMGIVYRARRADGVIKRTIALKLLHAPGASGELIARFARERDILAGLTHQHIARLYDAGLAESGQPYIALEYVEGLPLAAYCDSRQLSIRARLALLLQVLHAVQFAHASLVIHRDLKPSNILVTADGEVRLLDFGIAKLIQPSDSKATEVTRLGTRVLTPEYASPEQIRGDAVSTATDIYSLGVLFYELLCGSRPYRPKRATVAALEEAILSVDPVRPSHAPIVPADAAARAMTIRSLRRTLGGDLDSIALRALKKTPADRYPTADAFAQDIERFLRGEPVTAQPDRTWYRARKFLKRNALAVAISLLVGAALAAGLVIALWQAQRAGEEARVARNVQTFLQDVFGANSKENANPLKAQQTTARELLDIGSSKIDSALADSPRAKLEVLSTLGSIYHDLGLDDKAAALLQKRVDLARQRYGPNDVRLAAALRDLSLVLPDSSRVQDRLAIMTEALAILDRAGDHSSVLRANVLGDLAQHYSEFDLAKALLYAQASSELMKNQPPSEDLQEALVLEGVVLNQMSRFGEAEPVLARAVSVSKQAFGDPNPHLSHIYGYLAEARYFLQDFAGAEQVFRDSFKAAHELMGPSHIDTLQAESRLGLFLGRTGRNIEAIDVLRDAHERASATLPADDALNLPTIRELYGWELARFGNLDDGYALLADSAAAWRRRFKESAWVISAVERSSYVQVDRGDYPSARSLADEATRIRNDLKDDTTFPNGNVVARLHLELAVGHWAEAERALQGYKVTPLPAVPASPFSLDSALYRAEIALARSDYTTARLGAAAAVAAIRQSKNRAYLRGYEARALLAQGEALLGAGSPDQALPSLQEAALLHRELYDNKLSVLIAGADLALARCFAALARHGEAQAAMADATAIFSRHAPLAAHWRHLLETARDALARSPPAKAASL